MKRVIALLLIQLTIRLDSFASNTCTLASDNFYKIKISADSSHIQIINSEEKELVTIKEIKFRTSNNQIRIGSNVEVIQCDKSGAKLALLDEDRPLATIDISQNGRVNLSTKLNAIDAELSAIELTFQHNREELYGIWADSGLTDRLGLKGIKRTYEPTGHTLGGEYSNVRAPFFFSLSGFGVSINSDARMFFDFTKEQTTEVLIYASSVNIDVYLGKGPKELLSQYNLSHGEVLDPPDWALGEIWWRNEPLKNLGDNHNAQELALNDIELLLKNNIPITGYLLDRPYEDGKIGWGDFRFSSKFPDPDRFIKSLKEKKINLMLWAANRSSQGLWREGRSSGFLFEAESEKYWPAVDLRVPAARTWLESKYEKYIKLGVTGIKLDRGDEAELPFELANSNSVEFPKFLKETFEKAQVKESFIIARNAHDHARKYAAVWAADSRRDFNGLNRALKSALRSGFINYPLWGSDTGGFAGRPPTDDLLARWFAFSAYSPIFEVIIDREDWVMFYNSKAVFPDIAKHWAEVHHKLRPYVRKQLEENRRTGLPIIRALLIEFPEDETALNIDDEYMYGDQYLVAPILAADIDHRAVYLPKGRWKDVESGAIIHGPKTITAKASYFQIPVYELLK